MAAFKFGALVERTTSTATAAGTTTLVNNSTTYQRFTGATTQTVVFPDATTMSVGMKFVVQNRSTGVVTVNANGGGLLKAIAAGSDNTFQLYANSPAAGTWDVSQSSGGGGGSSSAFGTLFSIDPSTQSPFALSATTHLGAVFKVNSVNGPMQFNLPAGAANFLFTVVDATGSADANNITINRAGAEKIGNVAANYVFAAAYGEFTLMCDGTDYIFAAK